MVIEILPILAYPTRLPGISRSLSENALFPKLFVMPEKIILEISTICLW